MTKVLVVETLLGKDAFRYLPVSVFSILFASCVTCTCNSPIPPCPQCYGGEGKGGGGMLPGCRTSNCTVKCVDTFVTHCSLHFVHGLQSAFCTDRMPIYKLDTGS